MKETFTFNPVGVTFEGRQTILQELEDIYIQSGKCWLVSLVTEPENKFDKNAIAVYIDYKEGVKIGYIEKELTADYRALIPYIINMHTLSIGKNAEGILGISIFVEIDDSILNKINIC